MQTENLIIVENDLGKIIKGIGHIESPHWSYSKITKYDRSPSEYFKRYVLGQSDNYQMTDEMIVGSIVDMALSGQNVNNRFFVMEANVEPAIKAIVDNLFNTLPKYDSFDKIVDASIISVIQEINYQPNWKLDTKIKKVRESGSDYYKALIESQDKVIISKEIYTKSYNIVQAIISNPDTTLVTNNIPTLDDVEFLFQCGAEFFYEGTWFKITPDLIRINHSNKTIRVIDMKCSPYLSDYFDSNIFKYRYDIQATLYQTGLKRLFATSHLRDYTFLPFTFAVFDYNGLVNYWEFDEPNSWTDIHTATKTYKGIWSLIKDIQWSNETGNWKYKKDLYDTQLTRKIVIQ